MIETFQSIECCRSNDVVKKNLNYKEETKELCALEEKRLRFKMKDLDNVIVKIEDKDRLSKFNLKIKLENKSPK